MTLCEWVDGECSRRAYSVLAIAATELHVHSHAHTYTTKPPRHPTRTHTTSSHWHAVTDSLLRCNFIAASSAADLQGLTHFIGAGDATKVLDCNTPEDLDTVLQFEWTVNGAWTSWSAASLSANHTGVHVCYSHFKEQTLTAIHRVLPHGMCEVAVEATVHV